MLIVSTKNTTMPRNVIKKVLTLAVDHDRKLQIKESLR